MMPDKDRHLRMKLNDVTVRLMFCISPKILTCSPPLCASFFDINCWTGLEGKFLSDEVYEIRVSSLGDLFFSPERGDCLIVLLLVRSSGMKFSVVETEN